MYSPSITFIQTLYIDIFIDMFFFFSSRRRHTRLQGDWSSTCALPILVLEFPAEHSGPPARALAAARLEVQKVRATLERRLAERRLRALAPDEWLVVDG